MTTVPPVGMPAGAFADPGPASALADTGSSRPSILWALWHNRSGRIGCLLVGLVALAAVAAAAGVTPYNPVATTSLPLKGLSWSHLFGTDQYGHDIFSVVLAGIEVSLEIASISVLIAGVVGTLAGVVAGLFEGWAGSLIMRASDVVFAIPALLLALAIVTALGPGIIDSAIAIGVGYVPIFVRVVRGPVLSLRQSEFVRAGRGLGFSWSRLAFRHVLPNVAGVVAVQASLTFAWAILAEAGLSFLGLGPPPPTASLGDMVNQALSLTVSGTAWWTLAAPSVAIVIAVIGFNYLGDGLRDATDPRRRFD